VAYGRDKEAQDKKALREEEEFFIPYLKKEIR
jgi:hypothetical protein